MALNVLYLIPELDNFSAFELPVVSTESHQTSYMWKGRTVAKHLACKILSDHLVTGELAQPYEIEVQIDQILMHDGTGQVAILQLISPW